MKFTDLPTTKRGDVGERIVYDHLRAKGCHIYEPEDGPHPIDRFMVARDGQCFAFDVKTYRRQFTRPYTGIDAPDFEKYTSLRGVTVLLFFVDAFERCIYWIKINPEGHRAPSDEPATGNGLIYEHRKVYFPLSDMTVLRALTDEELRELGPQDRPERYEYTRPYFLTDKAQADAN
ncbi:hypothetical protein [Lewinella sp. W8]|uniref:hypothetical protein n=1 Tax=Lewinella sp. W8 TaxID=2528208 RepID=UPI001068A2E5|nr:hypothetical protein [Lewinella sp. W8]MTB50066.1 hypothetical protein [Lewinella sp. W8]